MPGKVNIGKSLHKFTVSPARAFGRTELANPDLARTAAKAATTRAMRRGWTDGNMGKPPIYSPYESTQLQKGVLNMATRLGASSEQMQKLREMDPGRLSQLYRNNKFVFELYFDYRGISKTGPGGSAVVDPSRKGDIDFLINEYNRAFTGEYTEYTLMDF